MEVEEELLGVENHIIPEALQKGARDPAVWNVIIITKNCILIFPDAGNLLPNI